MSSPTQDQVASYYAVACGGLALLHRLGLQRDPFDDDRQALWQTIGGHLRPVDRLDLVLADASVRWPLAFAASRIFHLPALADDEAFPPDWPSAEANYAFRATQGLRPAHPGSPDQATADLVADAWGRSGVPSVDLGGVGPGVAVVVGGPSALASLVALAAETDGVDLGRQATLVTDDPAERQWLGLAAAALGSTDSPRVMTSAAANLPKNRATLSKGRAFCSDDASDAVRQALAALVGA